MYNLKGLIVLFFCYSFSFLNSQSSSLIISDISCEGNDHTSESVIFREISISVGDTIKTEDLTKIFELTKFQILSTGLFNNVTLNVKNYDTKSQKGEVLITVEENWYLYPVPIFELADRNFSVWWNEQNKSLSRVNYGFRLSHFNLTGNKDPLKIKVHFGYTRKYELKYVFPYLSRDKKWGVGGSIFYSENREIAYTTKANKTQFAQLEDERKLLSRFRIGPEIKFRSDEHNFHALRLEYHHNKVDPYVSEVLNPDYFLNGKTDLQFFFLEYDFNHDKRSYRHYPLGGYLYFINLKKEGFGIFNDYDNLSITAGVEKHIPISQKLILSSRNKVKTNLIRNEVAFANNTGLGWDSDIVSGYELYVMDGSDFIISMNAIKFLVFDSNMNTVKWLPKQFRKMNMTLFLRSNFDLAYVNERKYKEGNHLNNRWIYGYGPAVDIIFFNNFIFSFEYSLNDIGESGLFFHNTIAF
ncbi:MAG: hypothetical protein HKO66_02445 [Saprospiraceae bacterium]|nr:hypothetical protein [Bacteroidia bacterium]NNE13379.1 hypothetical protein [Saprospiraceae bacterium]NNL91072.1 hypothetical protein [Saprospiraceae bacterium]